MNKKISELNLIAFGNKGYLPVTDEVSGETMKIPIDFLIGTSIGDIKSSMLTPEQFSEVNYGVWMLMDGQSCAGTAYASLTGNMTVPDMAATGNFLRQAKSGRVLGSYEEDAFQGHWHDLRGVIDSENDVQQGPATHLSGTGQNNQNQTVTAALIAKKNIGSPASDGVNGAPRVADETRPKNTAVNFFIRVE